MISQVRKRDGRIGSYDSEKITNAVLRALQAQGDDDVSKALRYTKKIEAKMKKVLHKLSIPAVEQIQDIIEEVLMGEGENEVAKSYILYRDKRSQQRSQGAVLQLLEQTMNGYLQRSDWRVYENSNVNYSLGGLILHNSGAVVANYWLNNVYPKEVSDAHRDGRMHIHDLSMFSGYCAGWSLRQLIEEGLGGVEHKVASTPAKHLFTLVNQMVNFLGVLQNEWAGAQAFSSFDTYLAPFVKIDNLSFKEVKQAIQAFVFGVNIPCRWGSQAPFTNITLDWMVPQDLGDKCPKIGGKTKDFEVDFTYNDCQKEMDMINKAFLEVMLEGDANHRGFAYPIPTYNITKDFDWDHKNCEILFKMAGRYGTPYFQNFVNSDLNPSDTRSMCCRLSLDLKVLRKRGGGLFGSDEFTGSIGVVTVNLPHIGYNVKTKEDFFTELSKMMHLAKESLEIKRKTLHKLMDQNLFPYTKRYLAHWNNHFSTIGIIGMNETCLNFMGQDITKKEAREFSLSVLKFMRDKLVIFQEETGNLYNLEATPGEGTSYRLAKIDKKNYSDIITSGDKDPYYTNSTQLPVGHTDDVFDALELQEELQTQYTGGTVFHAMLGEEIPNPNIVKKLVKKITSEHKIPYLTISPVYSVCKTHGYLKGEAFNCPTCNETAEVYARIVGYYRPVQNWNKGKKAEYEERIEFNIKKAQLEEEEKEKEKASKWLLFTTKRCPRCPDMKDAVKQLSIPGTDIDLTESEDSANQLAMKYSVMSVPTLLLFDEKDRVLSRHHSPTEVKEYV